MDEQERAAAAKAAAAEERRKLLARVAEKLKISILLRLVSQQLQI